MPTLRKLSSSLRKGLSGFLSYCNPMIISSALKLFDHILKQTWFTHFFSTLCDIKNHKYTKLACAYHQTQASSISPEPSPIQGLHLNVLSAIDHVVTMASLDDTTNFVTSADAIHITSAAANHTATAANVIPADDITPTPDITSTNNDVDATSTDNDASSAPETASTPLPSSRTKPRPSSKPCQVLTIPADLPLTEDERKGLTFIPLCPHINEFCSRLDIEHFFRCLPLCAYFFNQESNSPSTDPFSHFQHAPFSWAPPHDLLPSLKFFISNYLCNSHCLNLSSLLTHSNLSSMECATLCSLHSSPNLNIKPVNKGGGVV
eukprot:g46633.t1